MPIHLHGCTHAARLSSSSVAKQTQQYLVSSVGTASAMAADGAGSEADRDSGGVSLFGRSADVCRIDESADAGPVIVFG